MIKLEKWLHTIFCDKRMPGASFRFAYWLTLKLDGDNLNLSDYEREKCGARRTAQRALSNLEWGGYVIVDRTTSKGRYGQNRYTLTYPQPKARRIAA
jgi:hypothetical protein